MSTNSHVTLIKIEYNLYKNYSLTGRADDGYSSSPHSHHKRILELNTIGRILVLEKTFSIPPRLFLYLTDSC